MRLVLVMDIFQLKLSAKTSPSGARPHTTPSAPSLLGTQLPLPKIKQWEMNTRDEGPLLNANSKFQTQLRIW